MADSELATHNALQQVLRLCETMLHDLPGIDAPASAAAAASSAEPISLKLDDFGVLQITDSLMQLRISSVLSSHLTDIYTRAIRQLLAKVSQLTLSISFSSTSPVSMDDVRAAVEAHVKQKCDAIRRVILGRVQEANRRLVAETDSSEDGCDDAERDVCASRKHPPHALAILERAFSLSPNITHAEKGRLANAIGLTPRQVTVWFQNRRNRKKPPSVLTSGAASTPTTSSGKKRKLASIHDDEDDDENSSDDARMPVDLPEKRQRCSRQASYDSSSSFTSSSYASSGSEWTPAGQKYGRIGKPRNDSRDSNLTANTSISADSSQSLISSPQALKPASDDDEQDEIEDDEEGSEDGEEESDEEEEDDDDADDDDADDDEDEEEPLRPVQPAPHEFLFHPDGTLQPDWDDLELDLGQLEKSLASSFELSTTLGSPAPIGLPPQPLTPAALRMLDDLTPTTATFAEQQRLAASINPTVAAFNSISHAENWSLLESGVFNLPSQHQHQQQQDGMPDFPAPEDWARALLNFECDSEQIDEALRAMDEALGRTSSQSTPSLEQAAFPHIDSGSSLSSSSHSDAGSSLHLDFDFDFSRLGFTSSPLSTPSLCSDSSGTFSADAPGFTFEKEERKL
ncbi:hypothetical protein OC842_001222 [Tilletia horrida]|uniref:Homeobox domain-containing protein n=1 Tax=Tilletia horrida TaxID=155126 RepID=A0AAN6JMG0_9BASI|nr:hypothetical protein OC842_001222 [Tilletia horrida]